MAGPGAAPRARRPGDSAAGTAAGPAVRTASRGGEVRAARAVGGASLTGRPMPPPPPRPDREAPRAARQSRSARVRAFATCPSPPPSRRRFVPHSFARFPAPPRLGSPQRARRMPAHAPPPQRAGARARARAARARARALTRRRRRAPAEGNPRGDWTARRGQDWLSGRPKALGGPKPGGGGLDRWDALGASHGLRCPIPPARAPQRSPVERREQGRRNDTALRPIQLSSTALSRPHP